MNLPLSTLIKTLNRTCQASLEKAGAFCISRSNFTVEVEHWLLQLVELHDTDAGRIFARYGIDTARLQADLLRSIARLKTGNDRTPSLSTQIDLLIREAWLLASVRYGLTRVRSGVLLLAFVGDERLARVAQASSREWEKIQPEVLLGELLEIVAGSTEDEPPAQRAEDPRQEGPRRSEGPSVTPSLDQYTVDLTTLAREGRIDPVLGRDAEVRQMIDVLIRRRQNNPILTGEAGVGKTAVVEGFALRIARGEVPPALRDVVVRTLDLGLLQAGAGIKGEFENRLKGVIAEVKASARPIILFIDEAHTLIGAGGQAGQGDAANLLKPALARGELRTIAATTWAEYKKYFEKDAALTRRFQVIKVEEPDEATAIVMMRAMAPRLEAHHGVRILDEAIEASVRLSARYLAGRQLPDKSLSLLDTASARIALGQTAVPEGIEGRRRRIEALDAEIASLGREARSGTAHADRVAERTAERARLAADLETLEVRWQQEQQLSAEVRALRERIEAPDAADDPEALAALKTKSAELRTLQGHDPLVPACLDAQGVAEIIASWTGIPAGKMQTDEIQAVANLGTRLAERVVGQDDALDAIARRIRTARANLTDPSRPVGVFLLAGPSGVGKTETALALADALYGGERNLITINMSEYQEAHTVSGLKGAPPGYVGYGQGGVLTEAVRRRPYAVVLLDEVEKAHPDVMELFYQVFDKGTLEDGEGRRIDFKHCVILLTSNVGSDLITRLCADPETAPVVEGLSEAIRPELVAVFKPALLGRLVVVPYRPIDDSTMRRIVVLKLDQIARRVRANHRAAFTYDPAVVDRITARCTEVASGARNVDHLLTGTLLPALSQEVLQRMADGQPMASVHVTVDERGDFRPELS